MMKVSSGMPASLVSWSRITFDVSRVTPDCSMPRLVLLVAVTASKCSRLTWLTLSSAALSISICVDCHFTAPAPLAMIGSPLSVPLIRALNNWKLSGSKITSVE
jgi:hypothetical protein